MSYNFLTTERDGQNLIASQFSFFLFFQSIALCFLSQTAPSFTFFLFQMPAGYIWNFT